MKIGIVSPMVVGFGMNTACYSSQQVSLAMCWIDDGHQVDLMTLGLQHMAEQVSVHGSKITTENQGIE